MSESTYSVYLVEHGETGGKRHVTSPVEGHELQFYDTGVWIERETGRNFFPYEQVRTIREHPEGRESERRSESVAESAPAEDESDATEMDPQTDSEVEGDAGAEEDMLEE
jgi:hypothetical protein